MKVFRNDALIKRNKAISKYASLVGFAVLVGGLILGFIDPQRYLIVQVLALPIGWLLSQVGLYMAHRYLRDPRPDEVLDDALSKVARQGRMYHYFLPVPHVLLMPAGPIVFVAKFQNGDISVEDDKWRQRGVSFLRKLFSQESLGNPSKEADSAVAALASFIDKHAPSVEEVPLGAIIVFTSKHTGELDLDDSRIPAMHFTKLRGYFRQQAPREPLPGEDYDALREAFDRAAGEEVQAVVEGQSPG
jgi:hypothetical protein